MPTTTTVETSCHVCGRTDTPTQPVQILGGWLPPRRTTVHLCVPGQGCQPAQRGRHRAAPDTLYRMRPHQSGPRR